MDYFEVRYEDPSENRRHFYQLDGEGIRYGLVAFLKAIVSGCGAKSSYVRIHESVLISDLVDRRGNK